MYKCRVRLIEPCKAIHFEFKSFYDMNMTFIRMQEFYECPSNKIKGKVFTLEEYMDWYAGKYGDFDYLDTVVGMNLRKKVIEKFTELFEDLRSREMWALEQIESFDLDQYCVIATRDKENLNHEIRHAFYATHPKYRREVNRIVSKFQLKKVKEWLKEMGYHKQCWNDEINAYLVTGLSGVYLNKEDHKARRLLKEWDKEYVKPKLKNYSYIK